MTPARQTVVQAEAQRPVRPMKGRLDVAAQHAKIAKRYPKIIAELGK